MILGGGNKLLFGMKLAALNMSVKIIEQDELRCRYLAEKLDKNVIIINGDGTDITLLEDEDMASTDAFISATNLDEQNLLMAVLAKQEGVSKIIAKFSRPDTTGW